jgi:hypothetical protein
MRFFDRALDLFVRQSTIDHEIAALERVLPAS